MNTIDSCRKLLLSISFENKPQIKAPRVTPLEGVYTYCFAIRGRGVENPQGFGIDERRFNEFVSMEKGCMGLRF